jgi:hypothetical protein
MLNQALTVTTRKEDEGESSASERAVEDGNNRKEGQKVTTKIMCKRQ